jgi:predicted transcriptional regulator
VGKGPVGKAQWARLGGISCHMAYHMDMTRREVLVQLDDELVERLDRVARRRSVSRSELLREGALAVLEADETALADAALQQAYRRQPQDPHLIEAARRLAAETAPEW